MQVAEEPPLLEAAQKFVDRLTEFFQKVIMAQTDKINIVWEHNMMFIAASFIETYRQFRDSGKPTQVMLAYHYTDSDNLNSIECNGLMSKPERVQAGIESKHFYGETWGPGIYCCHDPLSTTGHGDTGILMAILRGNICTYTNWRLTSRTAENSQVERYEHDSVVTSSQVANKNSCSVLKTTGQVLPLVLFRNDGFVGNKESQKLVQEFHMRLQEIIDEFFNDGMSAPPTWFESTTFD